MPWNYSDKTRQLFMDAVQGKPGTHFGEIEDADGVGEYGAISCGDALRFTFQVKRDDNDPLKDVIIKARYETFGCTSAIAAAEALCALVEDGGYTPVEALKITNDAIVAYLEGLPKEKIHCSVMGSEALEAAVFNWAQKRGVDLQQLGIDIRPEEQEKGRIVCECFSLSEPFLRRKIKELNLKTVSDITKAVKAGGACGRCRTGPGGLQELLDDIWGTGVASAAEEAPKTGGAGAAEAPARSPYQFMKQVEKTIEEEIQPMLERDGGGIELVDIKDTIVYCRLKGACATCAGAKQTLKILVENTLKEHVDEGIKVIQVS